jgi:hypothetical protein
MKNVQFIFDKIWRCCHFPESDYYGNCQPELEKRLNGKIEQLWESGLLPMETDNKRCIIGVDVYKSFHSYSVRIVTSEPFKPTKFKKI